MGRSRRIASIRTLIAAVAVLTAACAGPAPTPGPSGGPTQGPAGNSLAALPLPTDGAAEIAALLGVPAATLDATQTHLEDDIVKQIGPGLGPVQLPASGVVGAAFHAGPVDVGSTGVGFLLIELGIMARALPSKEAAAGLVGMARTAAQGGRDAADSGRQDDKTTSSPFTSTSGDLSSAGSMDTTYGLTADHSLIDFHLGRMLTMNYTKGSDSSHVAIDIDSEESVDFCPGSDGRGAGQGPHRFHDDPGHRERDRDHRWHVHGPDGRPGEPRFGDRSRVGRGRDDVGHLDLEGLRWDYGPDRAQRREGTGRDIPGIRRRRGSCRGCRHQRHRELRPDDLRRGEGDLAGQRLRRTRGPGSQRSCGLPRKWQRER